MARDPEKQRRIADDPTLYPTGPGFGACAACKYCRLRLKPLCWPPRNLASAKAQPGTDLLAALAQGERNNNQGALGFALEILGLARSPPRRRSATIGERSDLPKCCLARRIWFAWCLASSPSCFGPSDLVGIAGRLRSEVFWSDRLREGDLLKGDRLDEGMLCFCTGSARLASQARRAEPNQKPKPG